MNPTNENGYLDDESSAEIHKAMANAGIMAPNGYYLNVIDAVTWDNEHIVQGVIAFDMPADVGVHLHCYTLTKGALQALLEQIPVLLVQIEEEESGVPATRN